MRRPRVAGVCVAGALLAAAGAVPLAARSAKKVQRDLGEIESLLRADDWHSAKEAADDLLSDLAWKRAKGERAREQFSAVLGLRALAEAGLGEVQTATWDWTAAGEIAPGVLTVDERGFGTASRALSDALLHLPLAMQMGTGPRGNARIVPPERVTATKPGDTRLGRSVRVRGGIVIGMVIDETGLPAAVKRLAEDQLSERPAEVVVMLEAVRSWRFRPATLDGSPVGVALDFGFP